MYKISELSSPCPHCLKDNMGNISLAELKRHHDSTQVKCNACDKTYGVTLHYSPFLASFQIEENSGTDIELFI